jgi:hypothetical protein
MTVPIRSVRFLLMAAVGFALVILFRANGRSDERRVRPLPALASVDGGGEPAVVDSSGDAVRSEVVLIYIGRSRCSWCRQPETKKAFARAQEVVSQQALARGADLHVLGVSLDDDVTAGMEHLSEFGALDELAVGGGWLNSVGLRYLWGDFAGPAATPQVLVMFRRVHSPGGVMGVTYGVQDEQLVVRLLGLHELERWVQRDAPIPWAALR